MSNAHPNRRTALALPSKGKHALMAAVILVVGLCLPILAVMGLGDEDDAFAGGSLALAPIPQADPIAPLNDETLDTPDLLAGDVPEGVNPTDEIQTANLDTTSSNSTPQPKRIEITPRARALPKAPITGLTRQSAFGPVPSRGAGNSLVAYRRPFRPESGKQPVSLIVGGLGVNRSLTQDAIQTLPADVTLSFAAHSVGLQEWINTARADGHEILIEIPMESANFDPAEPGADRALRISLPPAENSRRLDWMLSRAQGYAGLINFNGDSFLTRTDVAAPYMDRLSQTGIGFFTDGAFETPTLPALAKSVRQPIKVGHGLIDPDPIPRVISARLSGLGDAAKSGSHPVGVGFAYPETLAEIQNWIGTLDAQNLQLAPATAALK
jgi:polysaccharide deacetylase 2 family uncharacterized protein YibQ